MSVAAADEEEEAGEAQITEPPPSSEDGDAPAPPASEYSDDGDATAVKPTNPAPPGDYSDTGSASRGSNKLSTTVQPGDFAETGGMRLSSARRVSRAITGESDDDGFPVRVAAPVPVDQSSYVRLSTPEPPPIDSVLVVPTLLKIAEQVDRVLDILPDLFISSADILELAENLRTMRTLVVQATRQSVLISDLQRQCTREWNVFAAALEQRVHADESPNVIAFCETKLPMIGRVIEAIGGKRALFEKNAKQVAAFEALVAAHKECEDVLDGDIAVFERALRNVEARFRNGAALIDYATAPGNVDALKKTVFEFLALMREFTANARRAVSQRVIVASVAANAKTSILELFASAVPFRHAAGIKQVSSNQTTRKRKCGRKAAPKHNPPTRGRLFEKPRGIRALPSSRLNQ
jgi:hypothetical protein